MSNLTFSDKGWDDYLYWQLTDKSIIRKINELLKIFKEMVMKVLGNLSR